MTADQVFEHELCGFLFRDRSGFTADVHFLSTKDVCLKWVKLKVCLSKNFHCMYCFDAKLLNVCITRMGRICRSSIIA